MEKKYLVAAYPRSGTKFVANLLRYAGVPIGHEHVTQHGTVSWKHAVEDPSEFDIIYHQVREPILAISSVNRRMLTTRTKSIFKANGITKKGRTASNMQAYVVWHNKIQDLNPKWRFKVEEVPSIWDTVLEKFEVQTIPYPKQIPKKWIHHWGTELLSWDDMFAADKDLAKQIKIITKEYGYEAP